MLQQGDIRFLVTGALRPGLADRRARPPPRRRRARRRLPRRRRRRRVRRRARAGRDAGARAADDTDDARHDPPRRHRHLRRDRAHVPRPRRYDGPFAPRFEPATLRRPVGPDVGLRTIDHVVGNVEEGELERWVGFYEQVLGFDQLVHFNDDAISTEYSALMSTVVWDGDKVVLPINEPAEGRRKSQIEEYLDYYGSPGVQHLALRTDDIVAAVRALRDRGVRLLAVPPAYYDEAKERMADLGDELPWEALAELGILVDRDHDGYLLQIFTETLCDRPTVFFEIIQREGRQGLRRGQLQGAVRGHRARAGPAATCSNVRGVLQPSIAVHRF